MSTWNLGSVERIALGEGRTFRAGELEVAVFRTRAGELFATQAQCPHGQGPLADGIVGAARVVCPLHAYTFDLRTGCVTQGACDTLRTYPVEVSSTGEVILHV
ncbi:Rieske (2Fe-2S) protein [Pendulispora albinea]|uniref:Nitrite reductase (NAD(P)H) small subunit n=1 Tax=Pendulispora albinea TaxID=2741071 RepID=A0ABZ2LS71_9BACT